MTYNVYTIESSKEVQCRKLVLAALNIINEYYEMCIYKISCMTSTYIGDKWISKLLVGHCVTAHNLHGSSRATTREVLVIIYKLESLRLTCELSQNSMKIISRHFSIVLPFSIYLFTNLQWMKLEWIFKYRN
ncbi:hypothetical protein IEQ34_001253 [Dendrobium chrysotoxum]|uniref:Uncharacterized protein n=1 Tax=Dendrobium chrysotoxum TaxID=161865 RepID=A0AAV7H6C3_DENCH|nr:hypothetical protein IEQ34_001253 [Dendrobium chrysotoxum]